MSLSEIGLLNDFIAHPSVKSAMDRVFNLGKNKLISSWYRVTEAWYEFKSYHASLLSDLLYVIFRNGPICFRACRKIL